MSSSSSSSSSSDEPATLKIPIKKSRTRKKTETGIDLKPQVAEIVEEEAHEEDSPIGKQVKGSA